MISVIRWLRPKVRSTGVLTACILLKDTTEQQREFERLANMAHVANDHLRIWI